MKLLHDRWRLKAIAQAAIGRLPGPVADPVYHALQRLRGSVAANAPRHAVFVDRLLAARQHLGLGGLEGLKVVELGSGWSPVAPLLLAARGAAEVHTYDLNAHYSRRRVREAAADLVRHCGPSAIFEGALRTGRLPANVCYHPHTDLARTPPTVTADLAISQFVLEHVTPDDLAAIHRRSLDWIAPDGLWAHWVSPSDHRSYADPAMSSVDFLRYSPERWRRIAGNRFAYHNRLRLPQYRTLFATSGWEVAEEHSVVRPAHLEALQSVPLHPDFRGFTSKELVAGELWFYLIRQRD